MARYFFDFIDQTGRVVHDETGVDLVDDDAAKAHALETLAGLAKNQVVHEPRKLVMRVRNTMYGTALFSVSVLIEPDHPGA